MSEITVPKKKRRLKSGFTGRTNIIIVIFCIVLAVALTVGVIYLMGYRYTRYNFAEGYSVTFVGKVNGENQPVSGRITFNSGEKSGLSASVDSATGKIVYSNGDVYEGQTKDLLRHGNGKLTFADGRIYEGEFVADEASGAGKMTYAN